MRLTIILTSWDRPKFVIRAIESMLAQTSPHWRLIIQDDDSAVSLQHKIEKYANADHRITLRRHVTTNRQEVTRYAVLINEALPLVDSELVGYMCDNVEYKPEMVESVISFFANSPDAKAGYIYHERDMWSFDGRKHLGKASKYGHWDYTPPVIQDITRPIGMLDHSQVFHRLPVAARWEESLHALKCGDGLFFQELIKETGPIKPIMPWKVLSLEHLIK